MGWQPVGTLTPLIRPRIRSVRQVLSARVPASHWGEMLTAGVAVTHIAEEIPAPDVRAPCLVTAGSSDFIRWRYPDALLGYRALRTRGELAIVRCRARGSIIETALAELHGEPLAWADQGGSLLQMTGADAVVALGLSIRKGFVPLPGRGPTLVQRPLASTSPPVAAANWGLGLGDIELF